MSPPRRSTRTAMSMAPMARVCRFRLPPGGACGAAVGPLGQGVDFIRQRLQVGERGDYGSPAPTRNRGREASAARGRAASDATPRYDVTVGRNIGREALSFPVRY